MKKIKSLIKTIFIPVLCVIILVQPVSVSAATYSGTCGDNVTWSFNSSTGALTISGTGAMKNYTSYYLDNPGYYNYKNEIKTITISSGVTTIGNYAFYLFKDFTSITIPNSVTSIGDGAFKDCESLTSITIPSNVTSIGDCAFSGCDSLTSITIPSNVTSIGDRVLYYCLSLTSINVNLSNKYYSSQDGVLFDKNKTELIQYPVNNTRTSYTIPGTVTGIADYAFSDCENLTSVSIPSSVTSIGDGAFCRCYNLTSIIIPNSVTTIGSTAFYCCDGLTSLTIPSSVTSIGDEAFWSCDGLISVTILYGITSIERGTFSSCENLTVINIPNSVTNIGYQAFFACYSLTSITIPNSITSIGGGAFDYCSSLKSIAIPSSVTSIGDYAFDSCSSLNDVCYAGSSSQWNAVSIGTGNDYLTNSNIHYNHYEHSFTSKTTSSTYLKSAATCTSPAVYYYKCSGCSAKGTSTYTYGSALGHSYTSKTITSTYLKSAATCTSSAVYYYKCSRCSAKGTSTYTYGSALGHSYKTTTTKATTSKNGKKVQTCSTCGTSKTTTIYYPKTITLSKTSYTYNGKAQKPTVTVKDSKGNKIASSNYTVSYSSGRKECGTYTVTVTFKGNYSGKKSLKFKINLGKVTGLKQKSQKGIYFKWNKVTGATGYEVYSKNSKDGSYRKIKDTSKCETGKKTKESAYFKVRAYRTVKGKKIYGPWSDVKKFKAK